LTKSPIYDIISTTKKERENTTMMMMKEFVDKLNYEDLEKLEILISNAKMKKDKEFVEDLMNNVANALDKAKVEMTKRFEDKYYIVLDINGYTYYLDEELLIEVRVEDKEDECNSETLYYEVI